MSVEESYLTDEEKKRQRRIELMKGWAATPSAVSVPGQSGEASADAPKGFWEDVKVGAMEAPKQVVAGGVDAMNELTGLVDDVWDWSVGKLGFEVNDERLLPELPNFEEAESTTGALVRSASQFMAGFMPWAGSLKMLGMANGIRRGMLAGALAEGTAFDPYEDRMSNMIQDMVGQKIPVLEWLEADKNDSEAEARFKAALEGAGLDLLGEGVFKALKVVKQRMSPEVVEKVTEKIKVDVSDPNFKEEVTALQANQIDAEKDPFKGIKNGAEEAAAQCLKKMDIEGFVDSVHHCRFETEQNIEAFYHAVTKDADKPKVQTHAEVKQIADEVAFDITGLDLSDDRVVGRILKMRQVTDQLHKGVMELVRKPEITSREKLALQKMLVLSHDVRLRTKGATRNAARILSAQRISSKANHGLDIGEVAEAYIQRGGGAKKIDHFIKTMREGAIANPGVLGKATEDFAKKNWMEHAQTYWINALLSGPATHMRNAIGNIGTQGFKIMEAAMAASNPKRLFGHDTSTHFEDVFELVQGTFQGAYEAIAFPFFKNYSQMEHGGNAWKAFMQNQGQIDSQTFADVVQPAITSNSAMGKMAKWMGHGITAPSRLMVTADEFFKVAAFRGDMRFQASIQARGLKGEARAAAIDKFMREAEPSAVARATKEMRVATFQNEGGKHVKALQKLINTGEYPVLKFFMPFVRTPVNILKYIGHRTPVINRWSKQMQADIAAGGVRKEMAEARVALGSSLYGIGLMLAASGTITGGFDKKTHQSAAMAGGGQYKLKIGNKYFDISTADPFGAFFVMAADAFDLIKMGADDELEDFMFSSVGVVCQNLTSKTYLQGLSNALIALSGEGMGSHEDKIEWWTREFTGSFVPNFMKSTNRAVFDDVMRENRTFLDSLKRGAWGASQSVAPKLNPITGKERKYANSAFGINPFYVTEANGDPVFEELARKKIVTKGPQRTLKGVELNPHQYNDLVKSITQRVKDAKGRNYHQALKATIQSKFYQELPDRVGDNDNGYKTKDWLLEKLKSRYKTAGERMFIQQNQEIFKQ